MSKMTGAIAVLGVVAGLGAAALPLCTYAAAETQNEQVDVSLTLPDMIALNVSSKNVTLNGSGTDETWYNQNQVKVSVDCTHTSGYTLTMVGSTDGTNKNSMYNATKTAEIVGKTFTEGEDTESKWGYIVAKQAGSTGTTYTGIPAAATNIVPENDQSENPIDTTKAGALSLYVRFGAYIAPGQAAGEYTGQVTFTAMPRA